MKKLIAMLLCLTMVLSFAACAAKEEAPVEDVPAVEEETPAVEEEPVVEEDPTMDQPAASPETTPVTDDMPAVDSEETPGEEAPAAPASNSSLEILNAVWANYAEEEKFSIFGGNMESAVMDAPGVFDMAYAEGLTYNLLVPADQIANVAEAASMIHMMNANTFTCGVFRLADGVSAADFGAAMEQAVMNNQWMCSFPETLLIQDIDGAHVLVAFGLNDAMTPFAGHLAEAYPEAVTLYDQPIA